MQPIVAIYALWLIWLLCWMASAMLDARAQKLSIIHRIIHRIATIIGGLTLLFGFPPDPGFDVRYKFWPALDNQIGWALVGLAFVAFCLSCWARIYLGFALPGSKHREFVETGPYKRIRHPIYLSVIVAAFATALLFGNPSSLGGALLLAIAFIVKILTEEKVLREESHDYDDYAGRVPMLIPFFPTRDSAVRHAHVPPASTVGELTSAASFRFSAPEPASLGEPIRESVTAPIVPPAAESEKSVPTVQDKKLGSELGLSPVTTKAVQLTLLLEDSGEDAEQPVMSDADTKN